MFIPFECNDEWLDNNEELAENINGIGGKKLIVALANHLKRKGDQVEEIIPKDFGWCFHSIHRGTRYLITASMEPDNTEFFTGVVGVDKLRGLMEKIIGKNKMDSRDPVKAYVHEFLTKDTDLAISDAEWETS